jgi:hypothetical protein
LFSVLYRKDAKDTESMYIEDDATKDIKNSKNMKKRDYNTMQKDSKIINIKGRDDINDGTTTSHKRRRCGANYNDINDEIDP